MRMALQSGASSKEVLLAISGSTVIPLLINLPQQPVVVLLLLAEAVAAVAVARLDWADASKLHLTLEIDSLARMLSKMLTHSLIPTKE